MARYSKAAYIEFDTALRMLFDFARTIGATVTREDVARTLADIFESDNPNFDRERFMTAAGCNNIPMEEGKNYEPTASKS